MQICDIRLQERSQTDYNNSGQYLRKGSVWTMNCRFERENPHYEKNGAMLIWHPAERETYYDVPHDSWCMFRKKIVLGTSISEGKVKIFADTRYLLYVNGVEAGTGPCRSDPRWQYYDELNITELLRPGENCIAVLVLYLGYGTGQSISRIPALYADIKITDCGTVRSFSTDADWKCRNLRAHDPNAPRVNGCKGRAEIFDNRLFDENWPNVGYDDGDWSSCHQRNPLDSPFWNIRKREIAMLERRLVPAHGILSEGNVRQAEGYDIPHLHFQIMQELKDVSLLPVDKKFPYRYEGDGEKARCVIADFGKIYVGTAVVEAEGAEGDIIDIIYAEELFDGKPQFDGVSYRPVGRFILRQGKNRLPVFFGYEAFRYLTLILRSGSGIIVDSVSVLTREYPFAEKAFFRCENMEMNRLWDISAHTLEICLQDGYLDSPSREQQQWMGDGRYQAIMNYYYSGDTEMSEKLLLQIAQSQDFEGMTASRYPDGNHNLAPIPSYCLQWLCAFSDYYKFTERTSLIRQLYPNILKGIRWFSAFEGSDGLLYDLPYWNYCDMGVNGKGSQGDFYRGGSVAYMDMLYAEAMASVILCAKLAQDGEAERFFTVKRERLIASIREKLWNPEKNAYADSLVEGILSDTVSESVNALAVIGFEHGKRGETIFRSVFCRETRQENVVEVSVYSMILLSRALKRLKKEALSVELFLRRYHRMLASGSETTWEYWWLSKKDSNGKYISFSSACHAWGAAAIVLAAENILGIDPESQRIEIPKEVKAMLGSIRAKIFLPNGRQFTAE